MLRLLTATLALLIVLPTTVRGQTWSEEEQSAIDHILGCWEAGGGQEDWDLWKRVCNPVDDFTYWWTTNVAPNEGVDYWGKVNEVWWKENDVVASDLRPYRVKIYGDIAALYFYGVHQSQNSKGEVLSEQNYRLELLRKVNGGWQLLGGMGVPLPMD
jgi:hypothetical protein